MSVPHTEAGAPDALDTLAGALWRPLGAQGVYARTGLFETVLEQLSDLLSTRADPSAEVLRFPPVMSRLQLEKSGYLRSFPQLLGGVCVLHGGDAELHAAAERCERGADWTAAFAASDLVLTPAACYPLYPLLGARGPIPAGGLCFDVAADCFRHEPSGALARLQSFRMREFVRIGTAQQVVAFRERWMGEGRRLADALALPCTVSPANDPFFGRTGQVLAVSQLQQSLKFELLVPLNPGAAPTACMSFNYHRDYFAQAWNLQMSGSEAVHTACVAFGLDRLALALFAVHGLDPRGWPAHVRQVLAFAERGSPT